MLSNILLARPIIFFDLETTGTDIAKDKIVELSVTKFFPDGSQETKTRRFNPGIPIPPEATAVHGITDDDVKNEKSFAELAKGLSNYFLGCDIGGYNIMKFDIPLLVEEFIRASASVPFDVETRKIDAMTIFHKMEKRDLTAAYKFYCDKDHAGAHGAAADVQVSAEVFNAQISRYGLKNNVEALHEFCNDGKEIIDFAGSFCRNESGNIVFSFGKHKGKIASSEPNYLQWMLNSDFTGNTKDCIRKILNGELK